MLKLLLALAVVVLVGLAYARGSAAVPQGMSQVAPPPTPASGEVSVELTAATLTELLNQRLAGQSLGDTPLGRATLTRLSVQLRPNQLVASGDARVGDRTVPVSLAGHVDVQNGHPLAVVSDASAAGLPLPAATRESIRALLQEQVDREISRLQVRVRSVSIAEGKILIIGTRAR
jgi:hypothetical protein